MLALLLLAAAPAAALPRTALTTAGAPPPALPECLQQSYHGSYGGEHLFLPSDDCVAAAIQPFADLVGSGSAMPYDDGLPADGDSFAAVDDARAIVWVGHAGVRDQPRTREALVGAFDQLRESTGSAAAHRQMILETEQRGVQGQQPQKVLGAAETAGAPAAIELLRVRDSGMFLSVPLAFLPVLDTLLPRHLVPVGVSPSPLPLAYDVPEHYAAHLAEVTRNIKFDWKIASVVNSISPAAIKKDVRYLTGEDSEIVSRHSFTPGAWTAARWIRSKMEATGASCDLFTYLPGFVPDVICTYPATTNSTDRVILSAHFDSRGSFGNVRAPGGDDDGSGSGHVLAVANAIAAHNITFEKPVTLAFFSGEEQGLWGSHYYAKHLAEQNASVALQIQADMLAYRVPGEPLQLGLPATIELPEAGFLVGNLSDLYAPELVVGRTAACCSDHQSFLSYGFPATQVFERAGWIADPMYHNSGDLSDREGYDFEQIASIAKVTMAAVLEVAGYAVPGGKDDGAMA